MRPEINEIGLGSKNKQALSMEQIRSDFPILSRQVNGQRLVYLDSAATSQKPRSVIEAQSQFYNRNNANIHRDLGSLVAALAGRDGMNDEELELFCSMLVRSYDPCVSCSVH